MGAVDGTPAEGTTIAGVAGGATAAGEGALLCASAVNAAISQIKTLHAVLRTRGT